MEKELLEEAQQYIDDEKYESAIEIYENEVLKNNDTAMINLGYLYANGLGTEKDNDKAESCYKKSEKAQARKNIVALWIKDRHGDQYDTEKLIKELLKENDEEMWEYIAQSIGEKSVEELKKEEGFIEKYKLELVEFYYDEGEIKLYTKPPKEDGVFYIMLKKGVDDPGSGSNKEYGLYKKFRLKENIEIIEHITRI